MRWPWVFGGQGQNVWFEFKMLSTCSHFECLFSRRGCYFGRVMKVYRRGLRLGISHYKYIIPGLFLPCFLLLLWHSMKNFFCQMFLPPPYPAQVTIEQFPWNHVLEEIIPFFFIGHVHHSNRKLTPPQYLHFNTVLCEDSVTQVLPWDWVCVWHLCVQWYLCVQSWDSECIIMQYTCIGFFMHLRFTQLFLNG